MKTLFSEAIKLKNGIFYNLEYHQQMMDRTLQRFYGTTIDLSVLGKEIPASAKTGLFKCRVNYDDSIKSIEFIPYKFRKVGKLGVVCDNTIDYTYKYADRSRLDTLLMKSGCDDIIIVKNGLVTDSFSSNIIFRSGSQLYTPDSCLLKGTKRQYLLDRHILIEKRIAAADIKSYDRIFFINAMVDMEDTTGFETSSLIFL